MTTPLDRGTRQDVTDVLVRYATGIDQRDWALFRTCFTEDCVVDYGDIGLWHGVDEVTACDGRLDPLPSNGKIIGLDDVPAALDLTRRSEGPPRIIVHPARTAGAAP